MVEQHAAQVLENIGRRQGPRPAGRWRRGRSSLRGLRSATNGVLLAPGFRDRGFGDCCCRLGRPIAYFDGTLKVFHQPYLPAIRNGSVEPLPDRGGGWPAVAASINSPMLQMWAMYPNLTEAANHGIGGSDRPARFSYVLY